MYNYNHFYYFYITAQFGSITKASEYLGISQPSLSSQIKVLEETIQVNLFIRNGRSIELTPKGKAVYLSCSKMFKEMDGLTKFLDSSEGANSEVLNIAVSDQIERPFIAEIVGKFIKRQRGERSSKINLQTGDHEDLVDEYRSGKYDLFISHTDKSLEESFLEKLELPVALIGHSKFIFKDGKQYKNISSLLKNNQVGFVMPDERFKLRGEIDLFLAQEQYVPEIVFESNILAANVRVILEGAGIGFLPVAYLKKEIMKGSIASYSPSLGFWKHQLFMASSREAKKGIDEFKSLIMEEVNT